jgi:hypothetical protein
MIKDRFDKVEEYRNQVSPQVFEKVKSDYNERLQQATADLLTKKVEVDSEVDVMQQSFNKAAKQLQEQKHALEELDLRFKLGEFSDTEYKNETSELRDKVEKLSEIVASIEEGMNRYRSLFEDVELAPSRKSPAPQKQVHPVERSREYSNTGDLKIEDTGSSSVKAIDIGPEEEEEPNTQIEENDAFEDELSLESPDIKSMKQGTDISARLVMIAGEDAGTSYPLTGTTSIGRAESSTIRINDSRVSRQHSRIQKHGEEYIIIDLHSSNGTYVNGQKIDEYVLAPGDEIQIGDTVLQFQA